MAPVLVETPGPSACGWWVSNLCVARARSGRESCADLQAHPACVPRLRGSVLERVVGLPGTVGGVPEQGKAQSSWRGIAR